MSTETWRWGETGYLALLQRVLEEGQERPDRTGVGTLGLFGESLRFDLKDRHLPVLTTKKVHLKSVIGELLWFIRGDTNIRWLHEHGITIWDEWADENGDLGPIYGAQWRSWPAPDGRHIDQLAVVLDNLRRDPYSRRHVVSAWNVAQLDEMALPPCHLLFQFHVQGKTLSCQVYQRSADIFLGVPFNIASYALLTHMVASVTGLEAGALVMVFGDVHLYRNHMYQAHTQLSRTQRTPPTVRFARAHERLEDFTFDDIVVEGYDPHPAIPAPVAV